MKRILLYLFFLLATPTFFVACEDEPQEEPAPVDEEDENDENEEEEDGDENEGEDSDNGSGDVGQEVNELLVEKLYSYDADGQLSSTITYEYDDQGRQIKYTYEYEITPDNNYYSVTEYANDTESIARTYRTNTGELLSSTVTEYYKYPFMESYYVYFDEDLLSYAVFYEYDDQDRQIRYAIEYEDDEDRNIHSTTEYTGDTESSIIMGYNTATSELTSYTEIEYYKYPLIGKSYNYNVDGQLNYSTSYDYDDQDRQIRYDFEYGIFTGNDFYSITEYTGDTESNTTRTYYTETGELAGGYTVTEYYNP